jgi:hypothetical protein
MSGKEMMEYLRTASVIPSSHDSLFESAVALPEDDFAKVFDGKTRSLEGFSIEAPKPAKGVVQAVFQVVTKVVAHSKRR